MHFEHSVKLDLLIALREYCTAHSLTLDEGPTASVSIPVVMDAENPANEIEVSVFLLREAK